MLGHKQGQGIEGVVVNVELSRMQKGIEPLCNVEHFVMSLCLFPGVKDHIFSSIRDDNIFHDNSHAVLSPVNFSVGCPRWAERVVCIVPTPRPSPSPYHASSSAVVRNCVNGAKTRQVSVKTCRKSGAQACSSVKWASAT